MTVLNEDNIQDDTVLETLEDDFLFDAKRDTEVSILRDAGLA